MDRYSVCYEATQRRYRVAVTTHIRSSLKKRYGNGWEDQIRRLFTGSEWQQIDENIEETKAKGTLPGPISDILDKVGVNNFYGIFDVHFEELFPNSNKWNSDLRKLEKASVLGWAREVRNYRDPIAHPPETDISYYDAFRVIDSARRIVSKFDTAEASRIEELASKLTEIEAEEGASQSTPSKETLLGRLPSREVIVPRFVGRRAELEELQRWLLDPSSSLWALSGDGGKGKTAIAYRFAEETKLAALPPLEIVIWLSAKRQRFFGGASVPVESPDFWDLESALNLILRECGALQEEFGKSLIEKRELVLEYLREIPALVVLDDLDSLERMHEDAITFFVTRVSTTRAKVLITSRRVVFGLGAVTTEVRGFPIDEGREFVLSRVALFGLDASVFPRRTMDAVLDATDSSPLYIEDLLRLCAAGLSPGDAIKVWKEHGGDAARLYALSREFESLSRQAQLVLLACAVTAEPLSRLEIRAVTGLDENVLTRSVDELQRLFLVSKPRLIEGVERFEVLWNTQALIRQVKEGTADWRKCEAAWRNVSEIPVGTIRRREIASYIRQAVILVRKDEHQKAAGLLKEEALVAFPEDPNLLGQLGWVYKNWKDSGMSRARITDARECFLRSSELHCKQEDMYTHWAEMEAQQRDWGKSFEAAEKGLQILESSFRLNYLAGDALGRLAQELYRESFPSRATQETRRSLEYLRKALRPADEIENFQDRRLNGDTYRAIVLGYERLLSLVEQSEAQPVLSNLKGAINMWKSEHPDNPLAFDIGERLKKKFPKLGE